MERKLHFWRPRWKALMEENRQQIRAVLTPEQQERFDEMKGRFEKRMKERRGARGEFRG